ncbi:hypothetical protein [Paenibacillus sp. MBLB4367]|uniref:hypothetical protein n=1 Tax=Paenibacillus sp. MBLB4367 TaxID=3384767 RepID=UPI0039082B99
MKKFVAGIVAGILIAAGTTAIAESTVKSMLFPVTFLFNGEQKALPDGYETLHYNGHVYVPIRYVVEQMKGGIAYNEATQTVSVVYDEKEKPLIRAASDNGNVYLTNVALEQKNGTSNLTGDIVIDLSENAMTHEELLCVFDLAFMDKDGNIVDTIPAITQTVNQRDYGKSIKLETFVPRVLPAYDSVRMKVQFLDLNPVRGEAPPPASIQSEIGKINAVQGTYCWKGCYDYAPAAQLLKLAGYVPSLVGSGETITIAFDYDPQPSSIRLYEITGDGETPVPLESNRFSAPGGQGNHKYRVDAFWFGGGESSSAFAIEVK